MDLMPYVNVFVPTPLEDFFVHVCEATGLYWGVMSRSEYFFQPPKLHLMLLILGPLVAWVLWGMSRNYRQAAIARLSACGVGWSTKCPINTAVAYILIGCFAAQVYAKSVRPKPFIQLGWLLMPCHMTTLAWIYILLRQKPQQYGSNGYIASLLIAWVWNPLGALASPDWGDHQFAFEGQIFQVHHWLLVLLPVYYAARYHTERLSKQYILHFTWVPLLLNFCVKTPVALFLGLNVDYMLAPPPVKALPPIFHSIYYRPVYVLFLVPLSCACHLTVQFIAKCVVAVTSGAGRAKKPAR